MARSLCKISPDFGGGEGLRVKFKYRLRILVDESTARRASMTPEVVKKLRSTGTKLVYASGVMTLESRENHDIDEDLVKSIVKAIGKPVEATAEIEVNGRAKEVFKGVLNPLKPLGITQIGEREEEEREEEEEDYEEEDLFLDEEDMDEEDIYFGFRTDDDEY